MKKILVGMVSLLILTSIVGVAMAAIQTADATVSINTYVSTSITPCPAAGTFTYGSKDPGTAEVPIECQTGTDGALTITIEDVTNVDVTVTLSGTDYEKTPTPITEDIPIENTKYNKDADVPASAIAFPVEGGTAATLWTVTAILTDVDKDIWFWLSVPSTFLPAGTYESTYTFSIS